MVFSILFAVFFEVVFWGIFVSVIIKFAKRAKGKINFTKKSSNQRVDDKQDMRVDARYVPKYYYTYCDYCGAKVSKGDKKCPDCRAKLHN